MNRILAIVLCLALLAQHLARFSVTGLYELRKDFVAKNLCENRSRPELQCSGKCVLRKQLDKADQRAGDSKNAPKKTESIEMAMLLDKDVILWSGTFQSPASRPYNPGMQRMYDSGRHSGIFRPPLV